jgi:MFS family permease
VKETPPWLYKKGKDLEGNQTLNFLRGPRADVPEEIRGIQSTLTDTGSFVDQLKAFRKRSVYLPLILILFLMFFQQVSVTNIYGLIFFDYSLSAFLTIGLLQIFATFVSLTLVDFLGRKTLLVISGSGMVVCGAALVILSNIWDIEEIFMTSLGLLFIMSFSLGWGPIPWLMMSELVPLQVRGLASAAATFVNWLLAFSMIVIILNNDPVVSRFAWNIFSIVIMLCSIFFVLFLLPETKRCTLGEIEEHFKKGQVLYNPCKSMVQRSHRRQGCRGAVLCI